MAARTADTADADRARVLFVGAFPPPGTAVLGGMVTSCGVLLDRACRRGLTFEILDSTQVEQPSALAWVSA